MGVPESKPEVDVVVPVYGHWSLTEQCLQSLADQSIDHRVIVVDDKSPDDTLARLAEWPRVHVIALERNSGFAAACNAGLAAVTAPVVVLVNNDVVADPGMLKALAAGFADDAVGSVAPLLTRPDGTVDAFGITADVTMAGFLRLHADDPADATGDLPRLLGPYGAVAAYRTAAIREVGGLDENIFMYGEELDLALRLSAAGWRPEGATDARGMHFGGATAGRGSAQQRERAGYGRGYLLRAYGVLRSRHALRALLTELIVCLGDAVIAHDLASTRGRLRGWRAGKHAYKRSRDIPDLNHSIGFIRSLRLRVGARA